MSQRSQTLSATLPEGHTPGRAVQGSAAPSSYLSQWSVTGWHRDLSRGGQTPGGTKLRSVHKLWLPGRWACWHQRESQTLRDPNDARPNQGGTYPVITFWGQRVCHPGPEPRAGGLDGHGITYASQLATRWKRAKSECLGRPDCPPGEGAGSPLAIGL